MPVVLECESLMLHRIDGDYPLIVRTPAGSAVGEIKRHLIDVSDPALRAELRAVTGEGRNQLARELQEHLVSKGQPMPGGKP